MKTNKLSIYIWLLLLPAILMIVIAIFSIFWIKGVCFMAPPKGYTVLENYHIAGEGLKKFPPSRYAGADELKDIDNMLYINDLGDHYKGELCIKSNEKEPLVTEQIKYIKAASDKEYNDGELIQAIIDIRENGTAENIGSKQFRGSFYVFFDYSYEFYMEIKVYAQEEKIYFEFTDTSGGEKIYCCVDGILSNGQLESLIGK